MNEVNLHCDKHEPKPDKEINFLIEHVDLKWKFFSVYFKN